MLVGSCHRGEDLTWAGVLLNPVADGYRVALPASAEGVWGGVSNGEIPHVLGQTIMDVVVSEVPAESVVPLETANRPFGMEMGARSRGRWCRRSSPL